MSVIVKRTELWGRLRVTQSALIHEYQACADSEADSEILNLTQSIQKCKREIRKIAAALCKSYGRNVLWIEGEDD